MKTCNSCGADLIEFETTEITLLFCIQCGIGFDKNDVNSKYNKCKGCFEIKKFKEFSKSKTNRSGLQRLCRECDKKRLKKYYQDNIEEEREKRRIWQEDHRELHIEHTHAYTKRKRSAKLKQKVDE
jgi:hypothetical protein